MVVNRFFYRYWRYLLALICGFAAITTGPACTSGKRNDGGGSPLLIITSISSSNITSVGATITWSTNRPADSMVEYGLTTSYGNQVSLSTMNTSHRLDLFGLTADKLYHYRVKSKDTSGNLSSSGDLTFTTAKIGSPTPTPTPGFPTISSFTASPSSIDKGKPSTLSWSVSGATSLRLDPGAITVTGSTSRSVTPDASTTYVLTATNSVGLVTRTVFVTVNVPPPPGVFLLAPYTGPFTEVEARILFDRFGFGATPERVAQAVSDGLATTVTKLTTWQSENTPYNLDAIVADWVCDGWLNGDGLNTCSSSGTYDFHNKLYPDSKLIKFLHSPNQYFYKLILFLHDERLAGSDLTEDPYFMRHAYVDHWNMLLRAAQSGDYTQFMRDWMKDSLGHVFWQDGEENTIGISNENFAREFWELGTVGTTNLDGTQVYGDFDIAQAARVHTGYSRSPTLTDSTGQAYRIGVYRAADHATGSFFIFNGTPYQATVNTQEDLLQATFRHPRTSESLAEDLWMEFINPYKNADAIRELAGIIRHYNFNLTPVMQTIMRSKAIYDPGSKETLIKHPIELVIGLLRSLPGYNPTHIHNGDDYTVLAWHTGALDQTFFSPNSIFGWDVKVLAGASYIKIWRDVSNQLVTKTVGSSAEHLARYSLRDNFWTGLTSTDQLIDRLTSCFNVPLNASQRGFLKNYLDTQPRLGQPPASSPFSGAGATQQEERLKGAIVILINQPSYRTK